MIYYKAVSLKTRLFRDNQRCPEAIGSYVLPWISTERGGSEVERQPRMLKVPGSSPGPDQNFSSNIWLPT